MGTGAFSSGHMRKARRNGCTMDFLSKYAKSGNAEEAVSDLAAQFADFPMRLLIYFASSAYDGKRVSALIQEAFPGVVTLGCTSCSEITAEGLYDHSIAAMAFGPDALESVAITVAENLSTDADVLKKAFADLENQLGEKLLDLDYRRFFGITLFDGRAYGIETFLERIGNMSDIIFVGGYASDDFNFTNVRVFLNGASHEDAAILAVVKPRGEFRLLKTQSAIPTQHSFLVTGADESRKIIYTLDDRPAVEAYAEAMGMDASELTPEVYLYNPFGLMAAGQPFIRTVKDAKADGSMRLFCAVKEGMRLRLMKPSDIVGATSRDLKAVTRDFGPVKAILDFDCAHRALMLGEAGSYEEYAKLFHGAEAAGFSTFGEAYIGFVNQTSVMVLFA